MILRYKYTGVVTLILLFFCFLLICNSLRKRNLQKVESDRYVYYFSWRIRPGTTTPVYVWRDKTVSTFSEIADHIREVPNGSRVYFYPRRRHAGGSVTVDANIYPFSQKLPFLQNELRHREIFILATPYDASGNWVGDGKSPRRRSGKD